MMQAVAQGAGTRQLAWAVPQRCFDRPAAPHFDRPVLLPPRFASAEELGVADFGKPGSRLSVPFPPDVTAQVCAPTAAARQASCAASPWPSVHVVLLPRTTAPGCSLDAPRAPRPPPLPCTQPAAAGRAAGGAGAGQPPPGGAGAQLHAQAGCVRVPAGRDGRQRPDG